jgi:hypothetical protein
MTAVSTNPTPCHKYLKKLIIFGRALSAKLDPMGIAPRPLQSFDDVVSIAGWLLDDDNPFGPQGAKPKRILICPDPAPAPYLIAGHRYLYKEPEGAYRQQIWSEVIAYELAKYAAVPVPPAFLARDPARSTPGVLVEFFYGHPYEARSTRFVNAIERFQARGIATNLRRGSLHDNVFLTRAHKIVDWRERWAEMIAFDALISNTDRHSENWGFLVQFDDGAHYSLAPAFDNGTSLGFRIREEDLARFTEPKGIAQLVARGNHHFSWLGGVDRVAGHAELCARFVQRFGRAGGAMEGVIRLSDSTIRDVLAWATRFNFDIPFSRERAEFVFALTRAKRDALEQAVGG